MTETVFITKHALTKGITICVGNVSEIFPSMFFESKKNLPQCFHGEGNDWHRTFEGALARAEKMREAKIASLKKTIKKLEGMKFSEPKP